MSGSFGIQHPARLKEKRDRALLPILLSCGLRCHEAVELNFGDVQQCEEHWAIVDLKGKAGHTRTIPMPAWVKNVLDQWLQAANVKEGKLFRRVHKFGKAWGEKLTEKAIWHVVREYAAKAGIDKLAAQRPPQDLRSTLSRGRRRTGADSVSARARFHSNHGKVSGLQTADSRCRQR